MFTFMTRLWFVGIVVEVLNFYPVTTHVSLLFIDVEPTWLYVAHVLDIYTIFVISYLRNGHLDASIYGGYIGVLSIILLCDAFASAMLSTRSCWTIDACVEDSPASIAHFSATMASYLATLATAYDLFFAATFLSV